MSGMLAIINASEEDYAKLTEAIYNSEGAAQTMAETMQNNLSGQIEELMGGIETLDDVLEFLAAGAEAVQIGTANFTHPEIAEQLINELNEYIINNGFKNLDELKIELRK